MKTPGIDFDFESVAEFALDLVLVVGFVIDSVVAGVAQAVALVGDSQVDFETVETSLAKFGAVPAVTYFAGLVVWSA